MPYPLTDPRSQPPASEKELAELMDEMLAFSGSSSFQDAFQRCHEAMLVLWAASREARHSQNWQRPP